MNVEQGIMNHKAGLSAGELRFLYVTSLARPREVTKRRTRKLNPRRNAATARAEDFGLRDLSRRMSVVNWPKS